MELINRIKSSSNPAVLALLPQVAAVPSSSRAIEEAPHIDPPLDNHQVLFFHKNLLTLL